MVSGYVVDAYHLLDYITKNKIKDVFQVEMYVRNHMHPGKYNVVEEDFKERDERPFHLQIEATKEELNEITSTEI